MSGNKFFLLVAGLIICLAQDLFAQKNIGNYLGNLKAQNNEISFKASNGLVKIAFSTPGVFRFRASFDGKFEPDEKWMIVKYDWPQVDLKVDSSLTSIKIQTSELKLVLRKSPLSLSVYDKAGVLLSSEMSQTMRGGGVEKIGDTVLCRKVLQPDEHFFGFGERMDFLDRRGKKVSLNVGRGDGPGGHLMGAYNPLKANYSPITFFMSTKGYGIFFHNTYETIWDMGSEDKDAYSFEAVNGEMDYYFMYGPEFPQILNSYAQLTGRSPLLPKYAMGLHFGTYSGGTWGHENETSVAYVLALVRKFREMGIPLDILFLDSTWRLFANGGHGATTFEWRDTFKDPESMFDSLYAMNIHAVGLHIRPRLDNGPRYRLLEAAQKAGVTYPENGRPGEFPNFFDSTATDWWWNHAASKVAGIGAKFFKTDEGSAFGRKANESSKKGPTDSVAQSLHNVFPLAYTAAAFDKFQEFNGGRGMNQTREGYAGIQRYPYIFAGDWPSEWQFFGPIIKAGLNIGLSGVGYWTHCMGGFEQKADPELYIRWCQFGMLSPVAMVFGMDHPGYKEPWTYGKEGLKNFKKYDSLRYALLPYLYTTAHELYTTGLPVMRALVINHRQDYNVYNIDDQYMLGDNMMICPVTQMGARSRTVYLPEGTWYDYWTGKKYSGKQYLTVLSPLLQIPIFIKSGGIIPMQPEQQFISNEPSDFILFDIFPFKNSSYTLYDDDGESTEYQHKAFALTRIESRESGKKLTIHISAPQGDFKIPDRRYSLRVHTDIAPHVVKEGNRILRKTAAGAGTWSYEEDSHILTISPAGNSLKNMSIEIQ